MTVFRNGIGYFAGINIDHPHTLEVFGKLMHIFYINNLNEKATVKMLIKDNYKPVAIAYDKRNNKYFIYQNERYTIAIKNEKTKILSIAEFIKKYNLNMPVEECKKIFNIN